MAQTKTWEDAFLNTGHKWCSAFQTWVPLDFFNKDSGRIDGKNNKCKSCSRAAERRRYQPIPLDQQKPRGTAPILFYLEDDAAEIDEAVEILNGR